MRVEALAEPARAVLRAHAERGLFAGRDGSDPEMVKFWFAFQELAGKQMIPLRVVWGFRSRSEQAEMFRRGVTKAKPGQSAHNFGLALDIIHTRRAWEGMTRDAWAILGAIGKEAARRCNLPVVWGGDWKFYDPAHWEHRDWRALASVET